MFKSSFTLLECSWSVRRMPIHDRNRKTSEFRYVGFDERAIYVIFFNQSGSLGIGLRLLIQHSSTSDTIV